MERNYSERDFLKAYFRQNGITEQEIAWCEAWEIFDDCSGAKPSRSVLAYASDMVRRIKVYRSVTLDDLRADYFDAPWAWPSVMSFQKVLSNDPRTIRTLYGRPPILMCRYKNRQYFFNVGKEEPGREAAEKMLEEGTWYVYTYNYGPWPAGDHCPNGPLISKQDFPATSDKIVQ